MKVNDIGKAKLLLALSGPPSAHQLERLESEAAHGLVFIAELVCVDGPLPHRTEMLERMLTMVAEGVSVGHPMRAEGEMPVENAMAAMNAVDCVIVFLPDLTRDDPSYAPTWKEWCRPYIQAAQKTGTTLAVVAREA